MIGIIGGTGLEKFIDGEFVSQPDCSPYCFGKIRGVDVVFMSRHGLNHEFSPSRVPYANNVMMLKQLGCKAIVSLSACGSLRGSIKPGMIVVPKQVVDWTNRVSCYSSLGKPNHFSVADPFDEKLMELVLDVFPFKQVGSLVTIEGPRFSTRAESEMFRRLGFDLVNMTTCPECFLAKEIGVPYVVLNLVTDFDSWRKESKPVSFREVQRVMKANASKVSEALKVIVPVIEGGIE
jgi:5'-methylthioadenosine phosphorylase